MTEFLFLVVVLLAVIRVWFRFADGGELERLDQTVRRLENEIEALRQDQPFTS